MNDHSTHTTMTTDSSPKMTTRAPYRSAPPAPTGGSLRPTLLLAALPLLTLLLGPGRAAAQEGQTTIGGYGELHYNEPDGSKRGELDFHRFVIYYAHAFSDDVTFMSEVELEHNLVEAGKAEGGYIALEQAYLDWRFAGSTGLRAGILLIPVGIINERHEPATFHGVERPNVDRVIIPSTWFEAGAGLYGEFSERLRYQAYVVAGLKASGFSGSSGIRSGRQRGFRSDPTNPSFAGRLDFAASAGLRLGASAFVGNTTGGAAGQGSGTLALLSGDGEFSSGNFKIRTVGAYGTIGDANLINAAYVDTAGAFTKKIPDSFYGVYAEGSYNILPHLNPATTTELHLFARVEKYNTQASVTGFAASPANDRTEVTVGATLRPTYNTAFKADYQFLNNASPTDAKAFNLGVAYHFN